MAKPFPLSALRALSAFANTGSVTKAGVELNISHAAVSQHLRSLETQLGLSLFDRSGRGLAFTTDGAVLAQAATEGFGRIAEAIDMLTEAEAERPLQITTTPTFAAGWLMPRLAGFRADHPRIDLAIMPSPDLRDPKPGEIDAAIRYGAGNWPGLDTHLLFRSPLVLVAAPALLESLADRSIETLAGLPWLEELGGHEATDWLRTKGIGPDQISGWSYVPGNLMIDGARDGQGLAVTVRCFVEADLAANRLTLLEQSATDQRGYYLLTHQSPARAALKAFARWLKAAAGEDTRANR